MARSQGLNRLSRGINRALHKSENERGYIFITKDKALLDACHYKLNVSINGICLGSKTLDKYGRIFPGGLWRQKINQTTSINLMLSDGIENLDITIS